MGSFLLPPLAKSLRKSLTSGGGGNAHDCARFLPKWGWIQPTILPRARLRSFQGPGAPSIFPESEEEERFLPPWHPRSNGHSHKLRLHVTYIFSCTYLPAYFSFFLLPILRWRDGAATYFQRASSTRAHRSYKKKKKSCFVGRAVCVLRPAGAPSMRVPPAGGWRRFLSREARVSRTLSSGSRTYSELCSRRVAR